MKTDAAAAVLPLPLPLPAFIGGGDRAEEGRTVRRGTAEGQRREEESRQGDREDKARTASSTEGQTDATPREGNWT